MAIPTLTPASQVSAVILPRTGSASDVSLQTPIGVYDASTDFLSGAADQINYTYQKLGGDVLDIELTTGSVYAAYEEAVLEYSYIVNMHQSKNILSDILGMTTGTFDHDGELKEGELSSSLSGTHIALKYPKVTFALNQKYGTETVRPFVFPVCNLHEHFVVCLRFQCFLIVLYGVILAKRMHATVNHNKYP